MEGPLFQLELNEVVERRNTALVECPLSSSGSMPSSLLLLTYSLATSSSRVTPSLQQRTSRDWFGNADFKGPNVRCGIGKAELESSGEVSGL